MKIHLWGTDFRRSTAEFRRSLYLDPPTRAARLKDLLSVGFTDLVYLNTCNRVEFYTTARDYYSDTRPWWIEMLGRLGLSEDAYYCGYQLEGKSALRHLLRVASSLESLVVGEPHILGQMREGVRWTLEKGFVLSPSLRRAFQLAFETAKSVRAQTAIGAQSVSVASLGMEEAQRLEAEFPLTSVVVVGRSPMSVVVVNWLKKHRPGVRIRWANRTPELLQANPASQGTEVVALSDFISAPGSFSHLFTASASSVPLFDESFFERVDARAVVAFDFAEPPDIATLSDAAKVKVLRLDGLKQWACRNRELRRSASGDAEKIIDCAIRDFFHEHKEAPVLREFNVLEPVFLNEARQSLLELDSPSYTQEQLLRWAEKLVKRNVHTARMQLKMTLKSLAQSNQYSGPDTWDF